MAELWIPLLCFVVLVPLVAVGVSALVARRGRDHDHEAAPPGDTTGATGAGAHLIRGGPPA